MSFWPGNVLAIRRRPSTILVRQYGQASCYDPKHWLFGPWMDLELVLCDFYYVLLSDQAKFVCIYLFLRFWKHLVQEIRSIIYVLS